MGGKSLRRHQAREILTEGRPRMYTSRVGDEDLDRVSRVIRCQGCGAEGILTKLTAAFLLQLGWVD